MKIGLTLDQTLYKNGIVVGRLPIPRHSLTVRVTPNSLVTSSFAVSNVSLLGTDSVQLMIQPRVNFSLISGFMFHSIWANLAAEHYFQFARFILTGAFCVMFLAFFIRLKFEADKSSQILLLAVGICGMFSANPVGYALWRESHIRISDHFFSALFVTVYRLFLIWELSRAKTVALGLIAYGIVEGLASFQRQHLLFKPGLEDSQKLLPSENLRLVFYIGFVFLAAVPMVNYKRAPMRMIFCAFAFISTTAIACLSQAAGNDLAAHLLRYSVQVTFAAVTLFLYQTDREARQRGDRVRWISREILDSSEA